MLRPAIRDNCPSIVIVHNHPCGDPTPRDWHLHERDYVTVVVEGAGLVVEYDDGTKQDSPSGPGTWRYHGEHKVHRVTNSTDKKYTNVLIELKS